MPDFAPTKVAYGVEDRSWLGSAHGTDATESITLDVSKFTSGTHYPNGYIPSGIALGKVTASGKYGPYNDALSDGTQTLVGFLYSSETVNTSPASTVIATAMLTHGKVRVANLPTGNGLDANGRTDVAGTIRFI